MQLTWGYFENRLYFQEWKWKPGKKCWCKHYYRDLGTDKYNFLKLYMFFYRLSKFIMNMRQGTTIRWCMRKTSKHTQLGLSLQPVPTADRSLKSFWCLYYYLWTYFVTCSSVFIVDFEQVNAGWVVSSYI